MISGELFQSLAEVGLYSEMTDLISNQIRSMPQILIKMSDLAPKDIKKYKVVYVYTQFLTDFFDRYFDELNDGTILISHNSDLGIHQNSHKYLECNKIKAWYCQNRETSHPKLFSIPIGLANSQWPHGNQQLIENIRKANNKKDILVFKNFDINTNYGERLLCNIATSNNGISMSPSQSLDNYWTTLSRSVFIISPPGNGIDCHRIWEALCLRCVPIVKKHEAFLQFLHLPILFIDDWNQVTVDFLMHKSKEFLGVDHKIPELEIEFWKEKIQYDKR